MADQPKSGQLGPARQTAVSREITVPGPFQEIVQVHHRDERLYLLDAEVVNSLPAIGLKTKALG